MIASEKKESKNYIGDENSNFQESKEYSEINYMEKSSQNINEMRGQINNYNIEEDYPQVNNAKKELNIEVQMICQLLYQEKLCPDILQYAKDILEGEYSDGKQQGSGLFQLIQNQVQIYIIQIYQEQGIESMKAQVDSLKNEDKQNQSLFLMLHFIELDRIKYIVKEYLRVRLQKLENYAFYIYNKKIEAYLSEAELNHFKRFIQLKQMIFYQHALQDIKDPFQKDETIGLDDGVTKFNQKGRPRIKRIPGKLIYEQHQFYRNSETKFKSIYFYINQYKPKNPSWQQIVGERINIYCEILFS